MTIGIVACWRRGQRTALLLLLSPLAMGLAASGLGQYPYGGSARITQYAAPSICVLTGLGCGAVVPIASSRVVPTLGASDRRAIGSLGGLRRYQRPGPTLPQ